MSRRPLGKLGESKGAELLVGLMDKLAPAKPPAPVPPSAIRPTDDLQNQMCATCDQVFPHLTPEAARASRKFQNKKAKKAQKQGITVIKAHGAHEAALYRQALAATQQQSGTAPPATASATIVDFGESAFRRLAPMRESLEGFAANHRAAADISSADRDLILRRIGQGAERSANIVDFDNGYFLGYDFGTSTTKVVARNPYCGGGVDEAFAIDVPPSVASGGEAHLFPTAVYWNKERDHFSLVPAEGYSVLDSFKSALIQGRGRRICNKSGLSMAEAATAFVALHLAYCIGAALDENSAFTLTSINVGIPVAVFDGQENVALFDRVLSAATRLVGQATDLSRAKVKAAFDDGGDSSLPVTRHAELAGAIAGYCAATRYYLGGHMIIDCGSATLDIVTFDLDQKTHLPIGIYAASVENLGADACAFFLKAGASAEDCRYAARFEEHLVYKQTIKARPTLFCQDMGYYPYQIILIGGGIHSEIHSALLTKLATAFHKPFHHPEIASALRRNPDGQAGRLILADGLARDPIELRDIALPKPPPLPTWADPIAPGKDQV